MTIPTRIIQFLFVLLLSFQTSTLFASGSSAVGQAKTGSSASYNHGKRVFATKISCASCPQPDISLNKTSAQTLLETLPEFKLSLKDQESLQVYLKRRFKL